MAESIIKIEGIHPTIDGEYPCAIGDFTNRDFRDIKRLAGVRVQELMEAFEKGDTDLFVAFAVIALRHAGKAVAEDMLWDAPFGKLSLVTGVEEEVDDLPPTSAPPSESLSVLDGGKKPRVESTSSGPSSRNGSDSQEDDQSLTGHLPSDTGAMYPSGMSAT